MVPMYKTIQAEKLTENAIKLISRDWMLISACTVKEDEDGSLITGRPNIMTASWGGVGFLWNKPTATIYLRPSRYTKEIIDSSDTFALNILPQKYKTALDYCGCHSGRDEDKFRAAKLNCLYMNETPYVKEARIVIFCRKLYAQEFDPNCFTDEKICNQNYKKNDFHTMYIGEITKVVVDEHANK